MAEVHIFPQHDWRDMRVGIGGVNAENGEIRLATNTYDKIRIGARFFVQNIVEELDAPGEWYFGRDGGTIEYVASAGDDSSVIASGVPYLFHLDDADDVAIQGLELTAASKSGILVRGSRNRIEGCEIAHTGENGIDIEGVDNIVKSNSVFDVGLAGIRVAGGNRSELSAAGNLVENNEIQGYGQAMEMNVAPGIRVEGMGQTLRSNSVHGGPHHGIFVAGNDHIIEYNDIHHVSEDCQDCAGIYAYGDWTERGTRVRFNHIHDIDGFGLKEARGGTVTYQSPYWFGAAIYLDGGISGWTIEGNVVYRTAGPQVFIHSGRDNTVTRNILFTRRQSLDGSGAKLGGVAIVEISDADFFSTRNIPALQRMPVTSSRWVAAYPQLADILSSDYSQPRGNSITSNLFIADPPMPEGFVPMSISFARTRVEIRAQDNLVINGMFPVMVREQIRSVRQETSRDVPWATNVETESQFRKALFSRFDGRERDYEELRHELSEFFALELPGERAGSVVTRSIPKKALESSKELQSKEWEFSLD